MNKDVCVYILTHNRPNDILRSLNSIIESRNLVLNNYNMFCIISNIIENMEQFSSYKKERCNEIVSPMQYSIKDKVIQKIAWRLNIVL